MIKDLVKYKKQVGDRIASARKATGKSQEGLAIKTRLNRRTVQGYEYGERTPRIDILCNLCEALGVSADYLLGRTDTVDVVPVVRCKDCKHWSNPYTSRWDGLVRGDCEQCDCGGFWENWYCADGERRNDES